MVNEECNKDKPFDESKLHGTVLWTFSSSEIQMTLHKANKKVEEENASSG